MWAELLNHLFLYSQGGLYVTCVYLSVWWVRILGSLQRSGKVIIKIGRWGEEKGVLGPVGNVRHLRSPCLRTLLGTLALESPCWPVQKLQLNRLTSPHPTRFQQVSLKPPPGKSPGPSEVCTGPCPLCSGSVLSAVVETVP